MKKKRKTNPDTQHTKQRGESLVVAELGKRGLYATALAGNVPTIDILAYRQPNNENSKSGKTFAIQVKTSLSSNSFHLKLPIFFELSTNTKITGPSKTFDKKIIWIFVRINEHDNIYEITKHNKVARIMYNIGQDFINQSQEKRSKKFKPTLKYIKEKYYEYFNEYKYEKTERVKFYIIKANDLAEIVRRNHTAYLDKHDGKRRENPDSTHTDIKEKDLKEYENRWEYLK